MENSLKNLKKVLGLQKTTSQVQHLPYSESQHFKKTT